MSLHASADDINRQERPMEFYYNLFYRGRLQDAVARSTLGHYAHSGIAEAEAFMMMTHLFTKASDKVIAQHLGKRCVPWLEARIPELTTPGEIGPATWALGMAYSEGLGPDGVEKHEEAFECFKRSAEVNFAAGQNNVGNHFKTPKVPGVEVDHAEALKWYRLAAAQGHASAKYNIGDSYFEGEGVEKDMAEGVKWYLSAALDGHVAAQNDLAFCYDHGLGVASDPAEAVRWFRIAADHGDSEGAFNLAVCYETGRGMPHNRPDEVEALRWLRISAEEGGLQAMVLIGSYYEDGMAGLEPNETEAVAWYRRASEQNHPEAFVMLGSCYERGIGVEQNFEETANMHRRAAELGLAQGQYNLGSCYARGIGVPEDWTEAAKLFLQAARWDIETRAFLPDPPRDKQEDSVTYAESKHCYAVLLRQHRMDPENSSLDPAYIFDTDVEWFLRAAEDGYGLAQYALVEETLEDDEFLYRCIQHKHHRLVEIFCESGADLNSDMVFVGLTPLEAAVESRDARMVQLLLDYGVDMGSFRLHEKRHRRAQRDPMRSIVEVVEDGQGALAQACRQGVPDVVVQLLNHGADADLIPLLEQCKPKCFQHVGWDVRQHFMTRLGFSQSSRTSISSV
eukprot:gene3326-2454_t